MYEKLVYKSTVVAEWLRSHGRDELNIILQIESLHYGGSSEQDNGRDKIFHHSKGKVTRNA